MTAHDRNREDVLFSRVLDGEACPEDWDELEGRATRDPLLWQRLARDLRLHGALRRGLEDVLESDERADELPLERLAPRGDVREGPWRATAAAGWLAAAATLLLWLGATGSANARIEPTTPSSAVAATAADRDTTTAEDAFDRYVELASVDGRLLGELPLVLVDSRELPDGDEREVVYMRTPARAPRRRSLLSSRAHRRRSAGRDPGQQYGPAAPVDRDALELALTKHWNERTPPPNGKPFSNSSKRYDRVYHRTDRYVVAPALVAGAARDPRGRPE